MGGGGKKKNSAVGMGGAGAGFGVGAGIAPAASGETVAVSESYLPDMAGYQALAKDISAVSGSSGSGVPGGAAPPKAAAAASKVVSAWPAATVVGIAKKKGLSHGGLVGGGEQPGEISILHAVANPAYPESTKTVTTVNFVAEEDFKELPPEIQKSVDEREKAAEEAVIAGVTPDGAAVLAPPALPDIQTVLQKARESLKNGTANLKLGVSAFSQKAKGILDVITSMAKSKEEVPRVGPEEFKTRSFTFKKPAKELGGVHEKFIYADQDGKEWLFKPDKHSGGAVAAAESAVSRIAAMVGQPAVDVFVTETPHGKGSIQPFVQGAKQLGSDPVKYSPAQIRALVREHVISWATSEHDAKHDNFLVTPGGVVVGVDKGQAFKFFGEDKLSLDYHPNKQHGSQEPVYYALYRAAKEGKVKINPYDALPVIERFEKIPDAEYREILRPVVDAAVNSPAKNQIAWWKRMEDFAAQRLGHKPSDQEVGEEFLRRACERKNNLRKDFAEFFGKVLNTAVDFS
ncbi:hypothetical protein GFC01_06010 [Desulfofundulus thermobenzoicus]|uniref:Uncharacterized protein n=1 Tax=Desulfofundulus thermobenzoicus TaxID=29376 RepID=A0A6N7IPA1_9FIRM|nr:hypothetical protein [Desulfofundulus thermobenzoicus]MQL51824.1 hypothetical protein [Desulfofundulus thermobenzoicus]